ncbi:MAG: thermonuclease family protein [Parvibaculum sp.]|uniref:thermonuclease family protein n=1 Tax=Parvibaculum sp. TaxID=2024848 RepID=UPI0025D7DF6D|nr:thermonuclease family protein [Parvibaculum sp.]MCE9651187.1 thermonuclease family protein [Parvibaculum sp.]
MHLRRHLAAYAFILAAVYPAHGFACALARGESAVVSGIAEDGTLTLADGRAVKLAGIDMPRPDVSKFEVVAGQSVTLHYGGTRIDRYGRALALVAFGKGPSLQERLIAEGIARVVPSGDMRLCMDEWLAVEARARAAGRGLWRDPVFAVRRADDLAGLDPLDGSYQLVEGVIKSVAKIRGRIYFNFDEDWRTDFTVTVAPAGAKLFKTGAWKALIGNPPAIVGAKVRVRGFLSRYNGPGMTVAVPEQIELLDRPMPDEKVKAANENGGPDVRARKPHAARK